MRNASLILLVLASCAATPSVPASHPASATAPVGRLVGVAPSLRANVVSYPDVPPVRPAAPPEHHHHP